jgi:two-component system, NtrC family, sensor histidine kinase AtoS
MTKTTESPLTDSALASPENPLRLGSLPNLSPEENELLAKHFEAFSDTTNKLVAAHQRLQDQIKVLMGELERKNRQLEAVNQELANKIREEEEVRKFLDRLIDSMQTGLVALDPEGNLTRLNQSARSLLGWETDLPTRFEELLENETRNPLNLIVREGESSHSGETRLRKRDGEAVLVRYTAVPLAGAVAGEEPESTGALVVFEDLSQLRLLEEKVRRAGRLAALGELAAGVAHEMRNPLATMRGFLQLLPTEFEDPDFREECSTRLIREIDRLSRLTDELLELSRPIQTEHLETDLQEVLDEVLAENADAIRDADIEVDGEARDVPPLPLDRERIKQVLINLVVNACQAMPEGGELGWRLETREEIWGEEERKTLLARLSISDTGVGIESRAMDSLFDPFFTTKSHGTGLGLAICHRIVEEHGGVIRAESKAGKGSTFTLYFPVPSGS